jgi:hypothetical protein
MDHARLPSRHSAVIGSMAAQRQPRRRRSSSLSQHRRQKKTLTPPLLATTGPFVDTDWRGRLPNMLWLAALLVEHPGNWRVVDALDAVDPFVGPQLEIADGRLTGFEQVPTRARSAARRAIMEMDPRALPGDLGHAFALFDDCPGRWLYEDWAFHNEHDRARGIAYLRRLIVELADSRSESAAHVRMLSLGRYLQKGRLYFTEDTAESADVLSRYPTGCTDEERDRARQFARTTYDMIVHTGARDDEERWGKAFWQQTARLARSGHPAARNLR